ncbi:hypothetical protein SRABI96_04827 [Peribacillus sp. Bi96]|nr:hypothetical protein SRABI96_04827 [Peribacillus sp. Bi96]
MVYCGTIFAVRAITEGLRKEAFGNNVRTTIISPAADMSELPETMTDLRLKSASLASLSFPLTPKELRKSPTYCTLCFESKQLRVSPLGIGVYSR